MGYNVIGMSATKKGFTLIEFMVAMTLVAVLSGIAMTNFMGSQRRGRDVRRQSDLNQYRIALENYASVSGGVYPISGDIFSPSGPLANFLSGFPVDPQGNSYKYYVDTAGTNYVMWICTEVAKTGYEACSNGKSGNTSLVCGDSSLNDSTCDLP